MDLFKAIKQMFSGEISDEEVAAHEWVQCPNCDVNITKEDLSFNNGKCPVCKYKIYQES